MAKRTVSSSPKTPKKPKSDKKSSPSKGSGSGKKKASKPMSSAIVYDWTAEIPFNMAAFSRALGSAAIINIEPGGTVDIDVSTQPKPIVQAINIGRGSCINIMASGETLRLAPTINIGGGSVINVAVNAKIKGAADNINIAPRSTLNIVTAPTDTRCYRGKLNERSDAVREWAAGNPTAGIVQASPAPVPQGATVNTEAAQERTAADGEDYSYLDLWNKEDKPGCEAQ